jgi:anti-sigma B factor antagonist
MTASAVRRRDFLVSMITPACRFEQTNDGSTTTVRVIGELDMSTSPELRSCLFALANGGQECVVLDLSELDFIDSMGIGALVGGLKQLRSRGADLVLRSPTPRVLKVIELTHLDRAFTII